MSTPRRIDPKTASKRRAARRKRTRETMGRIGVLAIVAILIISTVATVILPTTVTAPVEPTATIAAALPTATQGNTAPIEAFITQADDAASKGNWNDAASLYRAYLGQVPENGEVHFKLAKVYLSMQPPNYGDAVEELDRAIKINPNAAYAQEAQALLDQHKDKALTPVTTIGSVTAIPGTVTPVLTVTGSGTVTGTTVVTVTFPPATTPAGSTPTP
ncbi:MAG: tetratricopeptide repeat protein [Chloroflexota bacterium]|nr:tetratricopeptide repeat protein [Chloroflexota bacterium]